MTFDFLQTDATDKRDRCILPCMTHHTIRTSRFKNLFLLYALRYFQWTSVIYFDLLTFYAVVYMKSVCDFFQPHGCNKIRLMKKNECWSAECRRDRPPFSCVNRHELTMWDILWVSLQMHMSLSVYSYRCCIDSRQCGIGLAETTVVKEVCRNVEMWELWYSLFVVRRWWRRLLLL